MGRTLLQATVEPQASRPAGCLHAGQRPSVSLPDNLYGEVVSEIATTGFSFASLWQ